MLIIVLERGFFFFLYLILPWGRGGSVGVIAEFGSSLVAALQSGIGMTMAAVWFWGVFFKFGPWEWPCCAIRKVWIAAEQRRWGSAPACLVFIALKTKGMLLLFFFNPHFCPVCLLFPSSHGHLSTKTENFTSWSPGMLQGIIIIIKEQNKIFCVLKLKNSFILERVNHQNKVHPQVLGLFLSI